VLAKFLALFGFDLHRQIQLMKDRADDFARQTTNEITKRFRDLGLTIAFAAAGAVFGLITLVIGLMALYRWVAAAYGPLAGDAVVGGITAILCAVMLIVAAKRSATVDAPISGAVVDPVRVEVEATLASPADARLSAIPAPRPFRSVAELGIPLALDLRGPLSRALQDFLAKPPTTGTPVDAVIRRAMNEAHAASPQAVDVAADLLRTGPRSALVGVLAGSALLGWFLARNGSFVYFLEGWPRSG
jgi:hypothetical protein